MRIKEIEIAASKKRPLPQYANAAEACLYFSLKSLYSSYCSGEVNKESAKKIKAEIIMKCEEYEKSYNRWVAVYAQFQHSIHLCHELMTKIEKSDDVHEIAELSLEAVSLLTGDEGFAQRQRNKLQKGDKRAV